MNQELENLINMVLAKGELTEKDKEIVLKKAEKLGEDKDEIELILEGKFAELKKQENLSQIQKETKQTSNKEGVIKKCPACGAPAESFQTKCSECGHEFRNTETNSYMNLLFYKIEEAQKEVNERRDKVKTDWMYGGQFAKDNETKVIINNSIATIISSFPFPNTKEEILEFLSLSFSHATKKVDRPKLLL